MSRNHSPLVLKVTLTFLVATTVVLGSDESNLCQEREYTLANDDSIGFRVGAMCGPNCLWQIAYAHGKHYSLEAIKSMAQTNPQRGTTIEGMMAAAKKMGFEVDGVETNVRALTQDPRIAIFLLKLGEATHYVILDKIKDGDVRLLDGIKFRNLSVRELQSVWDGYAILIGDQEHGQTDHLRRYFGRSLQISGLLILVVLGAHGINSTYSHFTKRR